MLVYPSVIDLSTSTLRCLSDLLRARRRERGTRWRRLTADRQALPALTHLRCGHTYAQLAVGFRVGLATVYRYIVEAVEVLAAFAPTLQQAMTVAANKAFVILDGTLLRIDRIAADRPYYSGKHPVRISCHTDTPPEQLTSCGRGCGTAGPMVGVVVGPGRRDRPSGRGRPWARPRTRCLSAVRGPRRLSFQAIAHRG
ncbi:hypothetical protein GCM10023084_72670 [Streptomyces lacrimifluminis]|uniref:Transposase Helix-turn-helix domain-containing protein n=1 Tax=Streptomyces lacrimifluminis TaxID=1500077 RepID=A0A917P692_9ACTN|nr:hypothetical protein GCM10012282_70750 [Streptomyces lacrimifluminis]